MKFITIEDLKAKNACQNGIRSFKRHNLDKIDWDTIQTIETKTEVQSNYLEWLCRNFYISLENISKKYGFLIEYNEQEKMIHYRHSNKYEYWNEYNAQGDEYWYEYNEKNELIKIRTK